MGTRGSILGAWLCILLGNSAWAQVTQRVSLSSTGAQGNGDTGQFSFVVSNSADGRYVAFMSASSNLVPGDTNVFADAFVRDRWSGTTERVSVDSAGAQGNGVSRFPSISADGRYVAFDSYANNLVPGDTNVANDVFVHDRQSGTTERVSVDSAGAQGGPGGSNLPCISADGRYVAFESYANNLVPGDTNLTGDVFVHDRQSGTTERVSVDSAGLQGADLSVEASISGDGRYVEFRSFAANLVPGDFNGSFDAFVRDRQLGTTERASVDSAGAQGNFGADWSSISADGRYVAFSSFSINFVPGDTNLSWDVFVHDRQSSTTERVSVDSTGVQGNSDSGFGPGLSISADGRYVAFYSLATNLVANDTNGFGDVFVRDRQSGTTERVSLDSAGAQGNAYSYSAAISADGRYVAFWSRASNLVPGDTNDLWDVFVRDRFGGPTFTSLCSPGTQGVIDCPCANPPATPGAGCENSSGTGGAVLSASGGTYLSSDSLVFTTSGERPTATSILMQGNGVVAGGVLFGQGVRCVGGTIIRRLFTKAAAGGSITAPDFDAGDPTVSARSAQKGDGIQAAQSRWYLVYYRDAVVLGGCPPTSTFNATQTGQVTWSP
jgi:Tol biopolymer transport system component